MEEKRLPHFTKAVKDREVTGIFSVFGNLDSYTDRMHPGVFLETFGARKDRILHLWQHDTSQPPIAVIKSLREVSRAELPSEVLAIAPEATGGAEITREYLNNPLADWVLDAIQKGSPLQMSFMYEPKQYDYEQLPDARYEWDRIRNLRAVTLREVSDVNFGANDATVASKATFDAILRQLKAHRDHPEYVATLAALLSELKAGARHSSADMTAINQIHQAAIDLGCTTCQGVKDPDAASDDDPKTTVVDVSRKQRLRAAQLALVIRTR